MKTISMAEHHNKEVIKQYKNADGSIDKDVVMNGVMSNVESFLEELYGKKQAASIILTLDGEIGFTTNASLDDLPKLLRGIADSIEKGEVIQPGELLTT